MAYSPNMKVAALRHYADGVTLLNGKRFDNAGYHFGFAAECATKHQLLKSGVREDEEAIWLHFQKLRNAALLAIATRTNSKLYSLLRQQNFMQEWDTKMRYGENGSVSEERANKWRAEADSLIGLMI